MTKKTKPAEQQKAPPPRKRRRPSDEIQKIIELAEALQPKRRRIKMETVPFGMDD